MAAGEEEEGREAVEDVLFRTQKADVTFIHWQRTNKSQGTGTSVLNSCNMISLWDSVFAELHSLPNIISMDMKLGWV